VCVDDYTHTINNKKYNIPNDNLHCDLLKLYTKIILNGEQVTIYEKHKPFGPVYIEFTFNKKYFNHQNIISIIITCNDILNEYLQLIPEKMETRVIVSDKLIKIYYPYICITQSLQTTILHDLDKINKINLIKKINFNSVNKDLPLYKSVEDEEIMFILRLNSISKHPVPKILSSERNNPDVIGLIIEDTSIRRFSKNNITSLRIDSNKNNFLIIKKQLAKYITDEKILKELSNHMTNYTECIEIDPVKNIGDPIDININVKYNYDGEKVNVHFFIHKDLGWHWDADIDLDDNNPQHKLLESIRDYLNETYYCRLY
jgi:hypothetical protein